MREPYTKSVQTGPDDRPLRKRLGVEQAGIIFAAIYSMVEDETGPRLTEVVPAIAGQEHRTS